MGGAARAIWISHGIRRGNTCESRTLRGRETVLGFHAEKKVMRMLTVNEVRLWNTIKDGEPYALKGASTVREGGHAMPIGPTVPTSLKDRIRLWKEGIRDVVMEICCALHNFRVRLTPWLPMV